MNVFNFKKINPNHTEKCFFGNQLSIARYDKQTYPIFEKLTEKQLGFFWKPEEVDLSGDSKDFRALSDSEKHIFVSNLNRQIVLDSVQGRAPALTLLPICSLPELESWIITWSFFETIHSRSYTYIIRNLYSDPGKVFDDIVNIPEILDCADSISTDYNLLIDYNTGSGESASDIGSYEHKRSLWLALNSVNALEGVRFYVSFACSWAFAELKKMEGNAKIIKFIARDENVHLAATQHLLKILPNEDKDFSKIEKECRDIVSTIFSSVVLQEKEWAKYLFKDGSLIGLNESLLCDYVDWIAAKRLNSIGLSNKKAGSNPLPWTQKWISGSEVQVAPQETQISSYIIGGVTRDISDDTFKGFKL